MTISGRWRELLQERLEEATRRLAGVPGVHGLIVGGSVGRGGPWPMSDIDLLPVYDGDPETTAGHVGREQAELVDWWAASGRAQTLDVGWLAFTAEEAREAVSMGASMGADWAVERLTRDPRWFHGMDKAFQGRSADPDDQLTSRFVGWLTEMRFHPAVVEARIGWWRQSAADARDRAHRERAELRLEAATYHLRDAARAVRHVVLEQWGERMGSMGREWTRFERMAAARGESELAERIALLAGASVTGIEERERLAPSWLRERIDLCWAARQALDEPVTPQENARDQIAAFGVHVARHRPDLAGAWTGSPDPRLDEHLRLLDDTPATGSGPPSRT
ncbi:nucleotidyltransferase domain-containing protein [Nonomuraea helvata]|uniref:Nucleotidyltransferase domain-containing protein n=1 Tax=Nonomuraea helvata TaxID=37484 RepID=A0ABV5RRA9_9ACTN